MSIVHDFRSMPDFAPKEHPPLSIDYAGVRREINALLRDKLTESNADSLHPGLDKILPGTAKDT
jgi:hypothetical protein